MSYGGGFGAQYGGHQSQGIDVRRKQIESLRRVTGIQEVRANYEYQLDVFLPTGGSVKLLISLPEQFPMLPPRVTVGRRARHSWVDERTMDVTGCRELTQGIWSQHVDVGRVVEQIRSEMFTHPPVFLDSGNAMPPQHQPHPPVQHQHQHQRYQGRHGAGPASAQTPAHTAIPQIPSTFPELDGMSTDELQKLSVDEAAFVALFTSLPICQQLDEMQSKLVDDNVALAQRNMSLRPELDLLKQQLAETHQELGRRKAEYDGLVAQERELAMQFSQGAIERQLDAAEKEALRRANDLADRFSKGQDTDVHKFSSEFREASKLAHMRKIKLAKLKELAR